MSCRCERESIRLVCLGCHELTGDLYLRESVSQWRPRSHPSIRGSPLLPDATTPGTLTRFLSPKCVCSKKREVKFRWGSEKEICFKNKLHNRNVRSLARCVFCRFFVFSLICQNAMVVVKLAEESESSTLSTSQVQPPWIPSSRERERIRDDGN